MTQTNTNQKCTYSPHEGCLPAPNILPLAKETFAKRKMFWNLMFLMNKICFIYKYALSILILSYSAYADAGKKDLIKKDGFNLSLADMKHSENYL